MVNFTIISFSIYFIFSILYKVFGFSWEPFDRINLISDVIKSPENTSASSADIEAKKDSVMAARKKDSAAVKEDFNLYQKAEFITNFKTGNLSAMPRFMEKLEQLKNGQKIKIRIAFFGDSMIEGDLLTQTLRSLLQAEYGGYGVGYLPMDSQVGGFRTTASSNASGWKDINFMTKGAKNMYISGHEFFGNGSGTYTDRTIQNSTFTLQKSILYGSAQNFTIGYNGSTLALGQTAQVNRQVLSNDASNQIKISIQNSQAPIYGVSFESDSGIILDNFSFRGITGVELNKLSEDFMKSIQQANTYDLIVMQYGVNLLFRPKDTDYSYYPKLMAPVFKKMKSAFSEADFMIISSADRAFRYDGTYKTAIGLPNLIETQALMAFENNFAFYNQFESMGGTNSIVKWAEETPALANKDYVHPNAKGAEVLAKKLFQAIQNDYQKYLKGKKN